jgi:hypothetical protein
LEELEAVILERTDLQIEPPIIIKPPEPKPYLEELEAVILKRTDLQIENDWTERLSRGF